MPRCHMCPVKRAQSLHTAAAWHLVSEKDLTGEDAVGRRRSMEAWAGKYKIGPWRSSSFEELVQGSGC